MMNFDVYCDESRLDLLCSKKPSARYMVIGSVWLAKEDRHLFKQEIHELRNKHKIGGEFKWLKISPSRVDFYKELANWFFDKGNKIRFRSIAVEQDKINLVQFHKGDQELGFYKFYYELLNKWILDFNQYSIFCDYKTNRDPDRLIKLKECLCSSSLSSTINTVQAISSSESVLIQLADVLTGAVAARLNEKLTEGSAKSQFVHIIENHIGRHINHTPLGEQKFNTFIINLQGGW